MQTSAPVQNRLPAPGHTLTWRHLAWGLIVLLTLITWVKAVQIAYPAWFEIEASDEQALQKLGLTIEFVANYLLVLEIFWAAALFGMGVTVFWKKSTGYFSILLSLVIITLVPGGTAGNALMQSQEALGWVARFIDSFGMVIAMIALFTFPTGNCVPSWTRWLIPVVIVVGLLSFTLNLVGALRGNSQPLWDAMVALQTGASLIFGCLGLYAQIYRYRKAATPRQQKQIRCWIWGFVIGATTFIGCNLWGMVIFPILDLPLTTFWVTFFGVELLYTLGFLTLAGGLTLGILTGE